MQMVWYQNAIYNEESCLNDQQIVFHIQQMNTNMVSLLNESWTKDEIYYSNVQLVKMWRLTHVLLQKHFSWKLFSTFTATMWFQSQMYTTVHIVSNSLIEAFWTIRTQIFLFIPVNIKVNQSLLINLIIYFYSPMNFHMTA